MLFCSGKNKIDFKMNYFLSVFKHSPNQLLTHAAHAALLGLGSARISRRFAFLAPRKRGAAAKISAISAWWPRAKGSG